MSDGVLTDNRAGKIEQIGGSLSSAGQIELTSQPNIRLTFDRGTILLREEQPSHKLPSLPGVLWDERVKAFRTTASNYRELVRSLGKEGFRIQDETRYGWGGALALSPPILRPYQEAALTAWRDAKGRGVVVLPTGAGKTHVAIAAIARVGKSAICLVPTRILLEQWRDQLQTQFGMSIGILGDGRQELAPILVSTFE